MVASVASPEDLHLVDALRAGDESAFMMLVERLQPQMLRIARTYTPTRAVAEEVVQEAWLGVLKGLDRFEGRSSLRTWIFRILVNTAKTRGERERRSVPFSSVWAVEGDEPAVEPGRFLPQGQRSVGHWADAPTTWEGMPEDRLVSKETLERIGAAMEGLPPSQREVMRMRDVLGWTSPEVCNALGITETNQRVLLHRARAKVRRALDSYLGEDGA
jgi:RNA polymerase sigma-70 factor (ECF subfamily)